MTVAALITLAFILILGIAAIVYECMLEAKEYPEDFEDEGWFKK